MTEVLWTGESRGPLRILIYGWGKTGTTALFYKMLDAFDQEDVLGLFEPKGMYDPEQESGNEKVVLVKALWHGVTLEEYPSYMGFDRRIWTVRDPRDFMISMYLYYWNSKKKDHRRIALVLDALRRKEADPTSISFRSLAEDERIGVESLHYGNLERRLRRTDRLLESVDAGLYPFRYEDMVDGKWDDLERYVGFAISASTEVPDHKLRVARSKTYGNWRNWLTEADVAYYRPLFSEFLHKHGYDDEWILPSEPTLDPDTSSEYVRRLVDGDMPPQT